MFLVLLAAACAAQAPAPSASAPLELVASIALPGVEGRIDHLAFDEAHGRLFVAALGNGSLELVDLARKTVEKRCTELHEPQGLAYVAERDELWLAQGEGGVLDAYRGATLERIARLQLGPDGDNLRYDAARDELWLGYASGALCWLDAAQRKALGNVRLPGHPEAFALEPGGTRVFANLPSERGVCVVDRKQKERVAFWPLESAQANYPLLFLPGEKHVLVGCRNPGKLLVLDSDTGKEVLALELSGDVDDLWHDEARGRIYASCGAGELDVFARRPPLDMWKRVASLETRGGARTSYFSAARKQLYLALPKSGAQAAEIRVYEARD